MQGTCVDTHAISTWGRLPDRLATPRTSQKPTQPRRHAGLERTQLLGVLARWHVDANAQVLVTLNDESTEPLSASLELPCLARADPVFDLPLPVERRCLLALRHQSPRPKRAKRCTMRS